MEACEMEKKSYPIMDLNKEEMELLEIAIECIDFEKMPNPELVTHFDSLRSKIKKAARQGGVSKEAHWEE